MDHRLLEIVACPVCNGKLYFNKENQELVCKVDGLALPAARRHSGAVGK